MALYHGRFIYSAFTMPFFKRMLGKKLVAKDIESVDPEFYSSLVGTYFKLLNHNYLIINYYPKGLAP